MYTQAEINTDLIKNTDTNMPMSLNIVLRQKERDRKEDCWDRKIDEIEIEKWIKVQRTDLKERLYGQIRSWVLECIFKSRSCTQVEMTKTWSQYIVDRSSQTKDLLLLHTKNNRPFIQPWETKYFFIQVCLLQWGHPSYKWPDNLKCTTLD